MGKSEPTQDLRPDAIRARGDRPSERIRDHARTLPNFLGIQYRRLPEGGFAHISVIVAFDRAGSMIARAESGDADFTPVVEAIERASRGTQ